MTVTSHDVARLARVSQATVSRALRGDPRVTETTRMRVREAAATLGYVRSELGRGLSTRATHRIALVAELENTLYHQLMAPIHDELLERGYRMALLAEHGDEAIHERLLDRSVDGAILMTTRLDATLPYELARRSLPFVFLNRIGGPVEAPSVTADNVGGSRAAGELLIGLGHTRIGAIVGPADTSTSRDREAGFRDALEDAGLVLPSKRVFRREYDHETGRLGFAALMAADDAPSAIFCANDFIAIGFLNRALELGITVPDDVAVIGFDDIDMAAWPAFELTTVRNPLLAMARRAAGTLIDLIESTGAAERDVFPTQLVLRRTHGAPSESTA
ncbi:MAG: LacI family DNA-binding transcriptional regulator [Acidimicrobiia bacterium]|nr:LacI family DNA-binding transcriptional regulator [Acidimicrobiia bacterium]